MRDKPNCICILRDESEEGSDPDARVIMASVLVRDHQSQLSRRRVEVSCRRRGRQPTESRAARAEPPRSTSSPGRRSPAGSSRRSLSNSCCFGFTTIFSMPAVTRSTSRPPASTFPRGRARLLRQDHRGANRQGEIAIGIVRSKHRRPGRRHDSRTAAQPASRSESLVRRR